MKIKYQLKVFYACRKYTQNRRHKMKTEIGEILKHSFEVFKDNAKSGYEENKFMVEKDLVEVKKFINILIRRAIMSKSCY